MKLSERLVELVKACFTGLWVESVEHEDAILEIAEMCRENQWRLASCKATRVRHANCKVSYG